MGQNTQICSDFLQISLYDIKAGYIQFCNRVYHHHHNKNAEYVVGVNSTKNCSHENETTYFFLRSSWVFSVFESRSSFTRPSRMKIGFSHCCCQLATNIDSNSFHSGLKRKWGKKCAILHKYLLLLIVVLKRIFPFCTIYFERRSDVKTDAFGLLR